MEVIKLGSFKTLAYQMKSFKDKKAKMKLKEEEMKMEDKTKKTDTITDQDKDNIIIQKKFAIVQNISSNKNVLTRLFKGATHVVSTSKTIKRDNKTIPSNITNNVKTIDKRSSKSNTQLSFVFNEKSPNDKGNNEDEDSDDFNYGVTRRVSKSFHKKSNLKKKNLLTPPPIEIEFTIDSKEKNENEDKINSDNIKKPIKNIKKPYYEKAIKLENFRQRSLKIKRMQKLSQDKKRLRKKPKINENSRNFIKNYIPPQERTNDPHCDHFLKIDTNKSKNYSLERYIMFDRRNKRYFNQKNWDDFIEFQNEWKKKINSKIQNEQQKTEKFPSTYFMPKINKSKSMNDLKIDSEIINVYDRLYYAFEKYNENKIIIKNLLSPSFKPKINKKKKIRKNEFQQKYGDILDYVLKKYEIEIRGNNENFFKSNNKLNVKTGLTKTSSNKKLLCSEKSIYVENLLDKISNMNDELKNKIDEKINKCYNKYINKNSFFQDLYINDVKILQKLDKSKNSEKIPIYQNENKNSLSQDLRINDKELLQKLYKLKSGDNEKTSSIEREYRLNIGENTPSFIKPNIVVASTRYLDFFINKK